MIETPRIDELEATHTAFIPLKIPRERMPELLPPAIDELVAVLGQQGVAVAGPLFAHHLAMSPETFDFEAGFPVAGTVKAAGRVQPGERRALKVARTVYHGPYEGLPAAWGEFQAWVEQQQLDQAPDIWECYVLGPESDPEPANWRTELNRPLRS